MAVRVSVIAVQRNGCPGTFSQSMCVRYGLERPYSVCVLRCDSLARNKERR
jgi:hypothetical protein